jgi:hypothetical protein
MRVKVGKALALRTSLVGPHKGFRQPKQKTVVAARRQGYDVSLGHIRLSGFVLIQ